MTDKTDAEFEAWAIREFGLTPAHLIKDAETGYYVNFPTQCYLDVWRASRASLVIELPKINPVEWACTGDECMAMQQGISMAGRRVRAAGLTVKE